MTNNNQLLEVMPEESIDFFRAVPDDNEEIKEQEEETELKEYEGILLAESFGFELLNQDNFATPGLTVLETEEILQANIKDRDEDLTAGIEKEKEPKIKGEISVIEQRRRVQVSQKMKAPDSMKIKYASHVWDKIRTWVEMTKEEISGMGCVRREVDGSLYVYEVYLLKQDNTSAFTDIDDEALMALMWELQELDDTDNGTRYDDLKYWWHSHNNMSTFWSGQDEKCIQQKLQHANWWLSTCHNIRNDITTRLDIADPPIRFDDLKCETVREVSQEIKEFCRKEYEEKVTEKSSYNTYSYGNRFPGAQGRYHNGYGGYGSYGYKNNSTTATRPTQAAKTKIEAEKTARAAQLIQQQRTSQAKETTQRQTTPILKSMDYAPIVNISDDPTLVNATPAKAAYIYQEEINLGKIYLGERVRSMLINEIRFLGLAYNPREASNPKDGIEWTVSGAILCGPNKYCYMLVVWNDEPETVSISQIVEMRYRNPLGDLFIARTLSVGENKFVNISLKCIPDNIIFTDEQNPYQTCVGIIFQCDKALSHIHLGEDFLSFKDMKTEDLMGKIVDINGEITSREDDTEQIKTSKEEVEEIKQLFDELVEYAEKTNPIILQNRILTTVRNAEKDTIVDILETLSSNMSEDADEQQLEEEAEFLPEDEAIKKIEIFVRRNPIEAFPYVWNVLPYMYVCGDCYEPTTSEEIICPHCKTKLPEVQE